MGSPAAALCLHRRRSTAPAADNRNACVKVTPRVSHFTALPLVCALRKRTMTPAKFRDCEITAWPSILQLSLSYRRAVTDLEKLPRGHAT